MRIVYVAFALVLCILIGVNCDVYFRVRELQRHQAILEAENLQLKNERSQLEEQTSNLTRSIDQLEQNITLLTSELAKLQNMYTIRYTDIGFDVGYNLKKSMFGKTSMNVFGAVGESWQRIGFFGQGRFWQFYDDDTNVVYVSSTDGFNWSNKAVYRESRASGYMCLFSLVYDNETNKVHTVYAGTSPPLYYRRGTPSGDGSISWDSWQSVRNEVGMEYGSPGITLDSNGYPWVGATESGDWENTWAYVAKSSTKNGSWTQEFFVQMNATQANWHCNVLALSDGRVLSLYAENEASWVNPMFSRLYTPSNGWSAEELVANDTRACAYCAVSYGDEVHVVWRDKYRKYVCEVGWEPAQTIGLVANAVLMLEPNSDVLYRILTTEFLGLKIVCIQKCEGVWTAETAVIIVEEKVRFSCYDLTPLGIIVFVYSLGKEPPYEHHLVTLSPL